MPTFSYVAVDDAGREVVGEIHAENRRAAVGQVREIGYYPMEVDESVPARAAARARTGLFARIRAADKTILTRQLSNLLGAGLTVVRALSVLIDNTENPRVREILLRVREEVQTGSNLSDTLAEHPQLFDHRIGLGRPYLQHRLLPEEGSNHGGHGGGQSMREGHGRPHCAR